MDYGKFKYENAQKAREARRNQTNVIIKEMKLRPKIDAHDYETKKGHVVRFLRAGDKVKITIMFRGREQHRPELGFRLLQKLAEDVEELGFVESSPKQDGRNMIMVLGPHKKKSEAKLEVKAEKEARAAERAAEQAEEHAERTAHAPAVGEEADRGGEDGADRASGVVREALSGAAHGRRVQLAQVGAEAAEDRAAGTPAGALSAASLHNSIGITILALAILRVLWRVAELPPARR